MQELQIAFKQLGSPQLLLHELESAPLFRRHISPKDVAEISKHRGSIAHPSHGCRVLNCLLESQSVSAAPFQSRKINTVKSETNHMGVAVPIPRA